MALVNPHPALKVSVPMNPMVDGWMGDDWFHNGAFRQQNMSYIYEQDRTVATNTHQMVELAMHDEYDAVHAVPARLASWAVNRTGMDPDSASGTRYWRILRTTPSGSDAGGRQAARHASR